MPTAYCNLSDAYGEWDTKNMPTRQQQPTQPVQPTQPTQTAQSICPNCNNCLSANNSFQQQVLNQTIDPRPRWIPQYPSAYMQYDPFNRYWMNNVPGSHIEEFGNIEYFGNSGAIGNKPLDTRTLIQIILVILVSLFIIQLLDCTKD
jgi:hypothetical protein